MMHPSSSISVSRSPHYLSLLALTAALLTAGCAALVISAQALGWQTLPNQALLEYQFSKIGSGEAPDTVFVGDSSLGNAVDAKVWSSLSRAPALNLALSASFGYAATYNTIRRVLAWKKPRRVVIMQTAEMLRRPLDEDGYLITAPGKLSAIVRFWRLSMNSQQVWGSALYLAANGPSAFRHGPVRPTHRESIFVNDYILQGPRRTHNPSPEPWQASELREEKLKYLRLAAALCSSEGIECIYAHGPLTEPNCSNSDEFYRHAARMIRSTGLALATETPICVPDDEIGDGKDHVRPDLKSEYTRRYFELLVGKFGR
jgi:hypothetical protein